MAPSEEVSQGGAQRGGPRRWTGKGPRPARHIPWPELFKHHESVLTGHLKMMDMVRKHCIEGSGNYITAKACVDRTHEMMRMFKKATETFIPPRDNIDRVPLGASSASMYPGYSPADHVYGEAAAEFGKQMAELKKKGIEVAKEPNGPEYDLVSRKREPKFEKNEVKRRAELEKAGHRTDGQRDSARPGDTENIEETDNDQLFIFDPNPTPVAPFEATLTTSLTKSKNRANDKAKRRISTDGKVPADASDTVSQRKAKAPTASESHKELATDEFEEQAESKHKQKEEKRKAKKDKKRKRDSESSELAADAVEVGDEPSSIGKPRKKKSKKKKSIDSSDQQPANATAASTMTSDVGRQKKRKQTGDDVQDIPEIIDGEQKRRKK